MSHTLNVLDWNQCPWTPVRDKMKFLSFQGCNLTATLTEVIPGNTPGPHRHEHEQLVLILQGECNFYVDGAAYHLTPGCLLSVPGGAEHCIVATGSAPVLNLDIFCPARPERGRSIPAADPSIQSRIGLFQRVEQEGAV